AGSDRVACPLLRRSVAAGSTLEADLHSRSTRWAERHRVNQQVILRAMWILQGDGESGGRLTFRVSAGAIKTVGRARGADFVLDAALVSRLHCRLEAGDEALEVVDLES